MNPVIHEVGPRDGLQIEKTVVPIEKKIEWIDALVDAGVDIIQLGSFVNPAKVPQMADTEALVSHYMEKGIARPRFSALVLNDKGLDRGFAVGVDFFCMGVSASDTHSRKNSGVGTDEAVERILAMAQRASEAGATVQLSVQSAFGCGFEGPVPPERVLGIIERYLDAGFLRISLADTAGHATPDRVEQLYDAILEQAPEVELACHFHDTYGIAIANCVAAWRTGVHTFESAFAGLGGCPFTALSGGNVATEDLVHLFHQMDLRKDIDLDRLIAVAKSAGEFFGREMAGRIHHTGPIPKGAPVAV